MAPQQTLIRPGEAVLGQTADHFKEGRAHIVVKVLGEKLLLSRPREAGTHVGGKFVSGIGGNRVYKHSLIPPDIGLHISGLRSGNRRTRIGNGPGTNCETWAGVGIAAVRAEPPFMTKCLPSKK